MKRHAPLPEGRLLHTEENRAAVRTMASLERSRMSGRIVEGIALRCDRELNLTVALGDGVGIVPRGEAAAPLPAGKVRDIAVISRVGRPVSVVVKDTAAGQITLSRRVAQQTALAYYMEAAQCGDVVPATVTHLEPFGVFADIGCGVAALLSIEKISTARIPHPRERFSVGQEIYAAVDRIDREMERVSLSHRELLGTWLENAARFAVGETALGTVRSVRPYGAFVELAPNLSGLTEPDETLREGERVAVYIKGIQAEKRKIKLAVISRFPEEAVPPAPLPYVITAGNVADWTY